MKKNIYKIGAAALLIGTIILSSISVQAIKQSNVEIEKENGNPKINPQSSPNKRYFIFGSGICCRFYAYGKNNVGWIKANLEIIRSGAFGTPPFRERFSRLFVFDLETSKIFPLKSLPDPLYITNFSGLGYAYNVGSEGGCFFYGVYALRGFASDVSI